MGRTKILALLLALPLMAHAQWTYVSTSTQTSATVATYDVAAGNFVVITVIGANNPGYPGTLTDSAGNSYINLIAPGSGSSGIDAYSGIDLGCTPSIFYGAISQTWYYGFAANSGVGVTVNLPGSPAGPIIQHIEAQIFSTSFTWAEEDWNNSLPNSYFAIDPSPKTATPANSNELWITTSFQFSVGPATAAATASATTALTAVGGTSWNFYSIPSGAQTFTFPASSASTCASPPVPEYDSYVIWSTSVGFHGLLTPPGGGTQPHVQVQIGQ